VEPVIAVTSLCIEQSHRSVTVCPLFIFFTYSFRKAWNRYLLNFVLENFGKIHLNCINFELDLAVLVTTLHKHARYKGFYAHKHSLMSTSTRAVSLTFNCVTFARIATNSKMF
jgi:hypothetical protein